MAILKCLKDFLQNRLELIKIPPYRDPKHGIVPDGLSKVYVYPALISQYMVPLIGVETKISAMAILGRVLLLSFLLVFLFLVIFLLFVLFLSIMLLLLGTSGIGAGVSIKSAAGVSHQFLLRTSRTFVGAAGRGLKYSIHWYRRIFWETPEIHVFSWSL